MGEIDLLGIGKFATAAKEPILKLIDVCGNAIGKVYEPTHIVRMAKARSEEIKLISSAINDNIDLPTLYLSGDIKIDTTSGQELAIRTQNRLQYQEMQKQQNIDSIVSNAYNELETEEIVSKEPVDKEWSTRFFDIAGEVSNEDLQLLWGKVLSGEIKQPGSYSLRTMETLRNISKKEAEVFSEIANYVFQTNNDCFVYNDVKINESENLKFVDILLLDEAGLLMQGSLNITINFTADDGMRYFIYGNSVIFIKRTDELIKNIVIPCYMLTKAGKEIYSIANKSFKESYVKNVATKLSEQNVTVSCNKIISLNSDGTITYIKECAITL